MAGTALLVIDMLNDFLLEGAPLEVPKGREIVSALKGRIEEARREGVPVIYICDNHDKNDEEFKVWPPHAISGTKGAEVIKELKPEEKDYIIEKKRYSGFFETGLDSTLEELGIKELIITGLVTNICILYTTADAVMRGYEVTVPKDSIAALNEEDGKFALNQMENILKAKVI
jgi:nicotinamidase-related amidase